MLVTTQSALDIPNAREAIESALSYQRECMLDYAERNYASDVSVADLYIGAQGQCRTQVSSAGLAMTLTGLELQRECHAGPDNFCIKVDLDAERERVETELRQDFFARVVALRGP